MSRRTAIIVGVALFGVLLLAWLSFGGLVKEQLGWLQDARQEGQAAATDLKALEQEHESAQTAVRGLSKQVMEATQAARQARAAAQKAEANSQYWKGQAAQLQERIGQIEHDRRARSVIRSWPEARSGLREFGYVVR